MQWFKHDTDETPARGTNGRQRGAESPGAGHHPPGRADNGVGCGAEDAHILQSRFAIPFVYQRGGPGPARRGEEGAKR